MIEASEMNALLLAALSGVSTVVGAGAIFLARRKSERLAALSLAFAAGVMLSICLSDFLPEAVHLTGGEENLGKGLLLTLLALMLGVLLSWGLGRLVFKLGGPVCGCDGELMKIGVISAIAFALHNLPEGMAMFVVGYEDVTMGIFFALAVILHNIPQGVSIALPIWVGSGSRKKALTYPLLAGLAQPLGALIAFFLLQHLLSGFVLGILFGLVSGIMGCIAIKELIPASRNCGNGKLNFWALGIGLCIMPVTHLLKHIVGACF